MAKKTNKRGKWIKWRHYIVRNILYVLLYPYARLKYGITVEKFKAQEKRPYLILYNHQTAFDQFFVGMTFRGPVYYLASEDLFSNGFVSALIRWLVAPISIKKQALDIGAVKTCIRVAAEGGTIAIAPEGNRTYSGRTEYMNPSIASLARKLGMPIALVRIEGGYGVQPRWSDVVRRGKMRVSIARVIDPTEYATLSGEELFALIRDGLTVDEAKADAAFRHPKRAEYIERVLYVCPFCGLTTFESRGDRFACKKCGREVEYGERKELHGVGFDLPFRFAAEWYDYQKEFVAALDVADYTEAPLFCDRTQLSLVLLGKRKELLCPEAELALYGDRITVNEGGEDERVFRFSDVHAMAVLGRNKLNIYHGTDLFQVKGSPRFNAVKYVNLYFLYKNKKDGNGDGKFLGL